MVLLVEKDSGDIVASSRGEVAKVVFLHVLMRLREFSGESDVVVKLESGRILKLVEGKSHLALLEIGDG